MIDTHCHLFKEYYDDIDKVISRMKNNIIIVAGCNHKSNLEVIELCKKYNNIYGTLGIHPSEIDLYKETDLKFIEENLNSKIVGIGEIGLDYHYNSNKEKQKELFIKQLEIANKYNKTVVIHSRDAINDTYEILKKYKMKKIIHCFSSSYEMANKFLKINSMIGVGGVLTFKNSKLYEVIDKIDIDKIVLETDSPYLSPEPLRSTRNEPCNIIYVAQKLAQIKGLSLETILKQTTINSISQFDLKIDIW